MQVLSLSNAEVKYKGAILVIRGVSMNVPEKGIVAILGANGAGKTTILKAISGLLRTEEGEVTNGHIEFISCTHGQAGAEAIRLCIALNIVLGGEECCPERRVYGDVFLPTA